MNRLLVEFHKNLIEETGTSFLLGVGTAAIKALWEGENNLIIKQVQAIRKGASSAQYALLFNTALFLLSRLRIRAAYSSGLSLLLCSYILGRRNGVVFGLRNAIIGLVLSLLSRALV